MARYRGTSLSGCGKVSRPVFSYARPDLDSVAVTCQPGHMELPTNRSHAVEAEKL